MAPTPHRSHWIPFVVYAHWGHTMAYDTNMLDQRAHKMFFAVKIGLSVLVPLLHLLFPSQGMDKEAFPHNYIPSCPVAIAGRSDRKSLEWTAGNCWSHGLQEQAGRSGWCFVSNMFSWTSTVPAAISLLAVLGSSFWAWNIPLKHSKWCQTGTSKWCVLHWAKEQKEKDFLEKRRK